MDLWNDVRPPPARHAPQSASAWTSKGTSAPHSARAARFSAAPESYVHVSRQLGIDAYVAASHDLRRAEVQERFHGEIQRLLDTARTLDGKEKNEGLEEAVVALRKLREGIVASARADGIAVSAYRMSVSAAQAAGNWDEFKRALQTLVFDIYPNLEIGDPERREWPRYARKLLLFYICYPVDPARPTQPYGPLSELHSIVSKLSRPILASDEVQSALKILSALRRGDFVAFSRTHGCLAKEDAELVEFLLPRYRTRTLAVLCKAYYTFPATLLARFLCFDDLEEAKEFVIARYKAAKWEGQIVTLRRMPGKK